MVVDHLECFKIKDPQSLKGIVDLDSAQFGLDAGCKITKATKFCVPVKKILKQAEVKKTPVVPLPISGQTLIDDYLCYTVKCPDPNPGDTLAADQFGTRRFTKFKASELCVPARKQ